MVPALTHAAVCVVGHLRTFTLPGIYSSFENLAPDAGTAAALDLFFVVHVGSWHTPGNRDRSDSLVAGPGDDKLREALEFFSDAMHVPRQGLGIWAIPARDSTDSPRVGLRHVEIQADATCSDMKRAWDGIHANGLEPCYENSNFLQLHWIEHCFQRVRATREKYDFMVRMRPDTAILAPFPWASIPEDRVTVVPKSRMFWEGYSHPLYMDWFFVVPWSMLGTWWEPVRGLYRAVAFEYGILGLEALMPLEYVIFLWRDMAKGRRNETARWTWGGRLPQSKRPVTAFHPLDFPVVVVRSGTRANCEDLESQGAELCKRWMANSGPNIRSRPRSFVGDLRSIRPSSDAHFQVFRSSGSGGDSFRTRSSNSDAHAPVSRSSGSVAHSPRVWPPSSGASLVLD